MSGEHGVSRTPTTQQARGGSYGMLAAQLRRMASSRGAASTSSADMAFARILSTVGERLGAIVSGNAVGARPIGQRSSLLGQRYGSSPARLSAPGGTWDGNATAVADVPYSDLITSTARRYGVSPGLIAAVVKAESGFNPLAQSSAGAKGLMQLMDGTARSLGVSDVFDPAQNVEGGAKFLSSLLRRYNDNVELALAGYNAGPGAVDKYGGIPPYQETRSYVSTVLNNWRKFNDAF